MILIMRISEKIIGVFVVSILAASVTMSGAVSAHRSGCHRWHSCPSDSGSYDCGDTGHSNYCGGPVIIPRTPVVTTSDIVKVEPIAYTVEYKDNSNEYPDYVKTLNDGVDGENTIKTTITYADGTETSRSNPDLSVSRPPVSKVIERGSRLRPTGFIDSVEKIRDEGWFGIYKGRLNVNCSYVSNNRVTLLKNDKVIDTSITDSNGHCSFRNVTVSMGDRLAIGKDEGRDWFWSDVKSTRVSEKYSVDKDDMKLKTEYDQLHGK